MKAVILFQIVYVCIGHLTGKGIVYGKVFWYGRLPRDVYKRQGEDCTRAEVERMGERLTGLSEACFNAMGAFYADDEDHRPGKGLFYCDPLYPLTDVYKRQR